MEFRNSPRNISSRRRIQYRKSGWKVHEFEVWSGELLCRVSVLRMQGSLLVWIGRGSEAPQLTEMALGVPADGVPRSSFATPLLGEEGVAASLARRLAVSLMRPVYVSFGTPFDRFTMPLIENALITEIKERPECF